MYKIMAEIFSYILGIDSCQDPSYFNVIRIRLGLGQHHIL